MHDQSLVIDLNKVDTVTAQLKVLSNSDRLKILCVLIDDELNVQNIEQKTDIHQPTLSQQLTVLRKSNMVDTRREGKMIYYRIGDPKVLVMMRTLYQLYCNDDLVIQ